MRIYAFLVVIVFLVGCAPVAINEDTGYDVFSCKGGDWMTLRDKTAECSYLLSKKYRLEEEKNKKIIQANTDAEQREKAALELEASVQRKKLQEQQNRQQDQQQAIAQDEARKIEAAKLKQNMQDESQGYFTMSFEDFQLDAKSMAVGRKIKISGYFDIAGRLLSLTKIPVLAMPDTYKLPLLADASPRETRKKLLELQNYGCGQQAVCPAAVLGRVQRCNETYMGRNVRETTCLAVDEIRSIR